MGELRLPCAALPGDYSWRVGLLPGGGGDGWLERDGFVPLSSMPTVFAAQDISDFTAGDLLAILSYKGHVGAAGSRALALAPNNIVFAELEAAERDGVVLPHGPDEAGRLAAELYVRYSLARATEAHLASASEGLASLAETARHGEWSSPGGGGLPVSNLSSAAFEAAQAAATRALYARRYSEDPELVSLIADLAEHHSPPPSLVSSLLEATAQQVQDEAFSMPETFRAMARGALAAAMPREALAVKLARGRAREEPSPRLTR